MLIRSSNDSTIQKKVEYCIREVLGDRVANTALDADTRLNAGLGMTSLELAELVLELEMALGGDPFMELVPITSVRTVGDLVRAYELLHPTPYKKDCTAL